MAGIISIVIGIGVFVLLVGGILCANLHDMGGSSKTPDPLDPTDPYNNCPDCGSGDTDGNHCDECGEDF